MGGVEGGISNDEKHQFTAVKYCPRLAGERSDCFCSPYCFMHPLIIAVKRPTMVSIALSVFSQCVSMLVEYFIMCTDFNGRRLIPLPQMLIPHPPHTPLPSTSLHSISVLYHAGDQKSSHDMKTIKT